MGGLNQFAFGRDAQAHDKKAGGKPKPAARKDQDMAIVSQSSAGTKPPARLSPDQVRNIEIERLERWADERVRASQVEPLVEMVTLSPALAYVLLKRNEANRPISEAGIDRLKRDISEGRWEFNGESIILSKDGKLNDGQHRCRAVIETERSIRMVIAFGPERDSRLTLDQGVARTVGHYLGMHGYADANHIATIAKYVWQYKERNRLSTSGREAPTKTQARLTAEHYKQIPASLAFVTRPGVGAICTRSMLAFAHFAISEVSGDQANLFMDRLIKGASLVEGDPILICRNKLIETRSSANIQARASLIFKAWNAHVRGERPRTLLWTAKTLPKLER